MKMRVVECVPNFSEGRRPDVVAALVSAIETAPVRILDVQSDPDHNRSVITFIGTPDAVLAAAAEAVRRAAELIDLRTHEGSHPRIGATDVIPFVPVTGVTMAECVELASELGRIVGEQGIPVFLYGEAATQPDRRELPDIRRGGLDGVKERLSTPAGSPDFGPPTLHQTAGATVIGARKPLIAFNVNLRGSDVTVARAIARAVRESSGGLKNVRAIGLAVGEGQTQVSMNLVDYEQTPIARVFELVEREAAHHGVSVAGSEIVGLVPQAALVAAARDFLRLRGFSAGQVLESWLVSE